jgi:hypothetical protein
VQTPPKFSIALALALTFGCTPATRAPQTAVSSECAAAIERTDHPRAGLEHLVRCLPAIGMQPVTPVRLGRQGERHPADLYTFYVPGAGRCYRVYAAGDRGIEDLDLLLRGPDGELAADITHDAHPILPPEGALCFDAPGLYVLEVSVFRGSGRYALQVWGG